VFTELRAPEHAAVRARGQAPGSAVEMTNTLDLADGTSGRTTLNWASEVTVSGMIASVGARLMQGAADKVTQQVFACIKEQLESLAANT
jgi:carbon monoxide dehydrogenase subunit G